MRNLYERLPYNSEVQFDMNEVPRESRFWDVNTYMLANLFDVLTILDWHLIAVNSKHPPKPPKPIKRPELTKEEKKPKSFWPGKTIIDKGTPNV